MKKTSLTVGVQQSLKIFFLNYLHHQKRYFVLYNTNSILLELNISLFLY